MLENSQDLFGGFGSDPHEYRSDLVTVARKRYAEFLGHDGITPNDMVVIGDSPRDIECAHANNVPCVAVTTGIFDREKLTSADCILEGFKDISESVSAIIKTNRKLNE
uniref:Uncharacterized protein n=1 Tax=Ciona savignyi TaxID=51511 RepID=H2YHG5_CIOSA